MNSGKESAGARPAPFGDTGRLDRPLRAPGVLRTGPPRPCGLLRQPDPHLLVPGRGSAAEREGPNPSPHCAICPVMFVEMGSPPMVVVMTPSPSGSTGAAAATIRSDADVARC